MLFRSDAHVVEQLLRGRRDGRRGRGGCRRRGLTARQKGGGGKDDKAARHGKLRRTGPTLAVVVEPVSIRFCHQPQKTDGGSPTLALAGDMKRLMAQTNPNASLPVDDLTEDQAAAELARLAAEMRRADFLYNEAAPELTDAEYDDLKARNLAIETRFPALIRAD